MKAEILCVGTEILLGDIVNTNTQYLARRLSELGIAVYHQSVVGDNRDRLKESYKQAFQRADIVITTGGLGPTKDDLTKEIAAEYFGRSLLLDNPSLNRIKDYFHKKGKEINEGNKKQAYFPKDAIILQNNNGTAPGCIIEEENKYLILLPGPPKEMRPMFEESVVPVLKKLSDVTFYSKVLRICGIGEGFMAEMIDDIIERQTNPTVAPYAKEGEVALRITAKAKNEEAAQGLIEPVEKQIRERLGNNIYGVGNTSLEEVVANTLIERNLTIALAESCTGGLIASKLVNCPGISLVFLEGAVTYSNDAKMRRLKVKAETLDKYGAVSEETAREMALGIQKAAKADIGISVTGIAGPDGGTPEKPVGLVYVGLCIKGDVKVKKLMLSGNREKIRNRTAIEALNWLRLELITSSK